MKGKRGNRKRGVLVQHVRGKGLPLREMVPNPALGSTQCTANEKAETKGQINMWGGGGCCKFSKVEEIGQRS